ncbi:MAG: shikimate dehydrogenase [Saprospiraceae bacterium]|nr:shikimate dehydrogenase [Saprospiraceae bacterium]
MRLFGIIGYPLSHSFSPGFFAKKFSKEGLDNCRYDAFPLPSIDLLPQLLTNNPNLEGLNVTIPYKSAVIPYLDSMSDEAQAIGAVNVLKIKDGKLIGHNSDVFGFEHSLRNFLPDPVQEKLHALVLGTGGASKAVQFVLRKMDLPFLLVSRNFSAESIDYESVTEEVMQSHQLVINTTPLGMSPIVDTCPLLPYQQLTPSHHLYDLVYNPEKTKFLALGESNGSKILNGLPMLYLQAEKAWEIWNA